jgi:hypothetical protein
LLFALSEASNCSTTRSLYRQYLNRIIWLWYIKITQEQIVFDLEMNYMAEKIGEKLTNHSLLFGWNQLLV